MSLVESRSDPPAKRLRLTTETDTIGGAIRAPVRMGFAAAFLFFGALAAWSTLAPLAGAVIAVGRIEPEGATRTVQHLEGGIVSRILVKEGQRVDGGDPLIELKDLQARSRHDELMAQDIALQIRQSRLIAEHAGLKYWNPYQAGKTAIRRPVHRSHRDLVAAESRLFKVRRKRYDEEVGIYESRIRQLRLSIVGRRDQIRELNSQKELLEQEIGNVETLMAKGLERMPRLLALKRQLHQLMEREAQNRGQIAEIEEQIGDFRLRQLHAQSERQEDISQKLADAQSRHAVLFEQLQAANDIMSRTVITAPTDGIVANIRIHTTGGVLAAGAPILDLVPMDEPKIVEALVRPTDIDNVHAGQSAKIHLSAYSHRTNTDLSATVETVSADLVEDQVTGQAYYRARIRIDETELAQLPFPVVLPAGMPVEVFITTDPRNVVSYLLEPMTNGIRRAFREP